MKRSDDDTDTTDGSTSRLSGDVGGPDAGGVEGPSGDSIDEFVPEVADATDDRGRPEGRPGAGNADAGGANAVRSDGGTVDSPFETTATVEETRSDRIHRFVRDFLRTPLSVMLSDWRGVVGLVIVGFYVSVGLVGTHLVEETYPAHGPQLAAPLQHGSHLLGTTGTGQDLLSLMVYSTAPILVMMASGAAFTVVVGTAVGILTGYKGGTVDTVLSTVTDVFINLPGLPLVIVLATLLEEYIHNPVVLGMLLAVASWAGLARALRSQVLTLRSESFVESARAMDLSTRWILGREILPHLMPYVAVNMVNAARRVIFAAVALYFLGVLPYSDANWGVILNNAYQAGAIYRPLAHHWLIVPMVTISGISVGLILLAQSLDRVFNPRARARHEGSGTAIEPDEEAESSTTDMMQV